MPVINRPELPTLMKTLISVLMAAASVLAETVDFDRAIPGQLPPHWSATQTIEGKAVWTAERDDSAPSKPNVLKQSGEARDPICTRDGTNIKNGFVEVKFKAIGGKEDQAAGVIWRFKDVGNYYIARADAREGNIAVYHTIDGKRTERKRFKTKVTPNEWHILRVNFRDSQFNVSFDGKPALGWQDDTFQDAGKVGLWTKADSVILFDDFACTSK